MEWANEQHLGEKNVVEDDHVWATESIVLFNVIDFTNGDIAPKFNYRRAIIFLIKTSPFLYIAKERSILHFKSVVRSHKSFLWKAGNRIPARFGIFYASPLHIFLTSGYCCRESMRAHFHFQSIGILAALIAMVVILTLASPHFLTTENIFSVIRSFSFVAISNGDLGEIGFEL